jgi:hypothetical protein
MSRIALAQIVRSLDSPLPAQQFLKNARDHGHRVERLIVAYSHGVDEQVVRTLSRQIRLDLVSAQGDPGLSRRLSEAGLQDRDVNRLLKVPSWRSWKEAPYGAYRNAAMFTALLEGIDYLIFFDSDVWPRELVALDDRGPLWKEIDFVGEHLASLSLPGVTATSSEYSGYYIVPPMKFEGLDQLLTGLGKAADPYCMVRLTDRGCLATSYRGQVRTEPTNKLLGGNLGLSLGISELLVPFYSSGYEFWGMYVQSRGEDTFLSQQLMDFGSEMIDIKLPVFHDTFVNFPSKPKTQSKEVRDRFYNACLGWIGRNPLLAWSRSELGLLEISLEEHLELQKRGLRLGGEKAARYLSDDRFETLVDALESSMDALPQAIASYRSLMSGWNALQGALGDRSYNLENIGVEPA